MTPPWTAHAGGGLVVSIRVTPRAGRDAIAGVTADGEGRPLLAVRLAAAPVGGAANAACLALLACTCGLRQSAVTLLAGETARIKRVHLAGDGAALAQTLMALQSGW